jgi:hypothetical protein
MVHSGFGIDQYPDSHLNAIAHAGFDAILVFAKGIDKTTYGYLDFNDLIRRATDWGLDTYFYSYLDGFKHPDDTDADTFFENSYGALFKHSPGAKGIILVGESCQFPSKDPFCSGENNNSETNSNIANPLPPPGWWPCVDYPQWLNAVKKAVHRYQPSADIVFWTYNWGAAPEKPRISLINNLPPDVTLQATFEMFEPIEYARHTMISPDYSITFPGPGSYFTSEAKAAAARNLRFYTMSNTGGITWDMGVVPYIPVPQQWFKRFEQLRQAKHKWNLTGLMDSHHYGWYPSVISECAKWCFWSPEVDLDKVFHDILLRDFGKKALKLALNAYKCWSDAIGSYTPGFDDQAGPLRIGPAYPLIFHPCLYPHNEHGMVFPSAPHAHFGNKIVHLLYNPEHIYGQTSCGRRIREDIILISKACDKWWKGVEMMRQALALVPERKLERATKMAGVGEFFYRGLLTTLHVKRWWLLNKQLEIEDNFSASRKIMDEMTEIAQAELVNVKSTMPLVSADSRLGWEPSMEYMADPEHLKWKIRQMENLIDNTLPTYRMTLQEKANDIWKIYYQSSSTQGKEEKGKNFAGMKKNSKRIY